MVVALKPIYDAVGIDRINVATYQSVSGTGKEAIDELVEQTRALINEREVRVDVYPKQIAFNVLPHIDVFMDNGYTKEEMKMVWETQKIMEDASIRVNPTTVRVPVFYGHSEAVHIETRSKISAAEARALLEKAPGVVVMDEPSAGGLPDPGHRLRGTRPGLCRAHPRGSFAPAGTGPLGGERQHSQGCGAQQRADRRNPDREVPELTHRAVLHWGSGSRESETRVELANVTP